MVKAKILVPIALASSLGAAYIAKGRITQLSARAESESPVQPTTVGVVVAAADLKIGAELNRDVLTVKSWPVEIAPSDGFRSIDEVVGRVVRYEILAGDPITERKLAPVGSRKGLSSVIPPGKVAMTVGVNVVSGVSGFILPGCRVDVIVTTSTGYSKETAKTKIILQNVEVVAVDQETKRESDSPMSVQAVTLLVTPEEAEKLALASTEGKLQLILRNAADSLRHETKGASLTELIEVPKPASPQPSYRPRSAPTPQAKQQEHTVEVFRQGKKSEVSFKEGAEPREP
ncbi:MAG: Flp pilus assembly protein CpaB [candidate division KSB1 bacterium]|nr:Flp pilus assembly protein CpaB [candidate division KSB1 bacterium]MDZ7294001.1 Flp pilus assembly protein CpaB [candidate division KSB1 bacterium]MDZ7385376.1 Flp pilus assembly protein CpaB [candidate division KSB1 bacterium]MDZ7392212.1 Flp pilus assembly protein CpaB [candidate division KSB1 bacterium]